MLRRVERILFRVPQLESAIRYYRDTLGMTLLRQQAQYAAFSLSDQAGELVIHSEKHLPAESVYFLVDDVQVLFERRAELGLEFIEKPVPGDRGTRATIRDLFGNVFQIVDHPGSRADTTSGLFGDVELRSEPNRDKLLRLYGQTARTADDLPYTAQFETLYDAYVEAEPEPKPSRAEVWRHLLNLRKGGKLPKLGEAPSKSVELPDEERSNLRHLIGEHLGRRDRLPYTEAFDVIVNEFNRARQRPLSPHQVWRLVATIAK